MIKGKYIVFRVIINGEMAILARDYFDKFKDAKKFLKENHKGKHLPGNGLYIIDCVGITTSDCHDAIFLSLTSEYSKHYRIEFLEQGE